MRLVIETTQSDLDIKFAYWLISRIKTKLLADITKHNLNLLDTYITESNTLSRLYKRKYKSAEIVMFAASNLICFIGADEIVITFDNNKFVPGFDRLRLLTAIKLINYGNRDVKGCHIFTDTFNYFCEDIDTYVKLYYMNHGV